MTTRVNLIYKLEGDIEGISVFDLSPILLSLGNLIQESNLLLNPAGKEVGVNVKPFTKGSFIINISLFSQTNAQHLLSLMNTNEAKELKELLEWIGLIVGGGLGTIGFLKWLEGAPKKIEPVGANEVRVTNGKNDSITIHKNVYELYKSREIQSMIAETYLRPLNQNNITSISSCLEGEEERTCERVEKGDIEIIYESIQSAIPGELVKEETQQVMLYVLKTVFAKGKRKWEFVWNGVPISALISDGEFFNKLGRREILFGVGDALEVNLKIKKLYDPTYRVYINDSYEIIEVIKHIPNAGQEEMGFRS